MERNILGQPMKPYTQRRPQPIYHRSNTSRSNHTSGMFEYARATETFASAPDTLDTYAETNFTLNVPEHQHPPFELNQKTDVPGTAGVQWTKLDVPHQDEDEAERLGAKWDQEEKVWRAPVQSTILVDRWPRTHQ